MEFRIDLLTINPQVGSRRPFVQKQWWFPFAVDCDKRQVSIINGNCDIVTYDKSEESCKKCPLASSSESLRDFLRTVSFSYCFFVLISLLFILNWFLY